MMTPFSPPRVDIKQLYNKVHENFGHELEALRDYFNIPGLAVLVSKDGNIMYESYKGVANIETKTPMDDTVQFPLGSLTRIFTQMIAEASNHAMGSTSHKYNTSQLLHSLSSATKKPFKQLVRERILDPLEMHSTYFLSDHSKIPISLASPHIVSNDRSVGHIEYGIEEVSGLVSTVRDLHLFDNSLDDLNLAMDPEINFSESEPLNTSDLPWVCQKIHGVRIMWSYGQMDCYGSQFIKIPNRRLTLILLSNSSVLTEASKLHFGNIMNSLFAQCFFKYYVNNSAFYYPEPTIENNKETYDLENKPIDQLLARALALSYKATSSSQDLPRCIHLLGKLFQTHPNYLSYADITLLHTLCQIKEVCYTRKLMPVHRFDKQIVAIARHLLSKDKDNAHINTYLGTFYLRQGRNDLAKQHFSRVVSNLDSVRNWYTGQAMEWMDERMNLY